MACIDRSENRTNVGAFSEGVIEELVSRMSRLSTAIEMQTNVITRLVQTLDSKQKVRTSKSAGRLTRAVLDKPIAMTPIVEAAVNRALAHCRK